jgi:hypothetical protein
VGQCSQASVGSLPGALPDRRRVEDRPEYFQDQRRSRRLSCRDTRRYRSRYVDGPSRRTDRARRLQRTLAERSTPPPTTYQRSVPWAAEASHPADARGGGDRTAHSRTGQDVARAEMIKHERPGPSTIVKCYRLLHGICETAVEDSLIARNPCVIEGASVERPDERPHGSKTPPATSSPSSRRNSGHRLAEQSADKEGLSLERWVSSGLTGSSLPTRRA